MLTTLLSLVVDTLTLGWRHADGWRFWYGAGATLTLVVLLVRMLPAVRRFFRDTQWSGPAILMGAFVLTIGPLTLLTLSTVVWPAMLVWLLARRPGA